MVLGAERALQILNSPNALKTIRSLSIQAAKLYGTEGLKEYDDRRLKVDAVIRDGDVIAPGDLNIKVIETLGHTKCSLSFLVNNETLFASESTGCRGKTGRIYPGFVTSYYQAIASIHKCEKLNPRHIISPHFGLVNKTETATYWKSCIRAAEAAKEFILNLLEQGYDEDRILTEYEVMFRDEENRLEQPLNAFILNAQRMIKAVEYTKLCDEKVV
jgi:glyoxylase-like metal-dependent hydrolase (beta-lactamase superfamily II)